MTMYVRFVITAACGGAIGYAVVSAGRLGHVRNHRLLAMAAAILAFVGLYVAWAHLLWRVFGDELGMQVFDPRVLWTVGAALYEQGVWNQEAIDGAARRATVSGMEFILVWMFQSSVLIATSVYAVKEFEKTAPYCEKCFRWTKKVASVRTLDATGEEPYRRQFAAGDWSVLDAVPPGNKRLANTVHFDWASCEKCQSLHVLSIRVVRKTRNMIGVDETAEGVMFRDILVPTECAEQVRSGKPKPSAPSA